jgi:hypothetical protein
LEWQIIILLFKRFIFYPGLSMIGLSLRSKTMSTVFKTLFCLFALTTSLLAQASPQLPHDLQVGDIVFIRVNALPFRKVAEATNSWTNHVGVVSAVDHNGIQIGESTFPVSRHTTLTDFAARSENGDVVVMRLKGGLNPSQKAAVAAATARRLGIFYDTGFDLESQGEFCSRFVREVLQDATGRTLGEIETFSTLLSKNPQAGLGFWQAWFFGQIPWSRKTVTPASILHNDLLTLHFSNRPSGGRE